MGEKNGVIRVQPIPESKLLEDSKHFWSYGFHDNEYGSITNICLSYDEKFLFSAGNDSNIFGVLFNSTLDDLEKASHQKIRITCKVEFKECADIDDASAYSLEEAKQKSEHDKMLAVAEAKKQDMRNKIGDLRKIYKDLLVKNDQLVPRIKLSKNVSKNLKIFRILLELKVKKKTLILRISLWKNRSKNI